VSYLGKTGAVPKEKDKLENHKLPKSVTEKAIQKSVEDYLKAKGLQYIRVPDKVYQSLFSVGSGLSAGQRKQASIALKGQPDLTVLLRDGRYICIELKRNGGKQSLGQKQFERSIGSNNYHICYSVKDVDKLLKGYGV